MAKARYWGGTNEEEIAKGVVAIMCPGCNTWHMLNTKQYVPKIPVWSFNGNMDLPTFSPSLLVRTGLYAGAKLVDENDKAKYPNGKEWNEFLKRNSSVCHSFIREGKIQFLGDCTHELKNKTVDLPEIN